MVVEQIREVIPIGALKGGRVLAEFEYRPGLYRVERKIIRSGVWLSSLRMGDAVFRACYQKEKGGAWSVIRGGWVKTRALALALMERHARKTNFSFSLRGDGTGGGQWSGGFNCAYGVAINREVRAARTGG